MKFRWTMKQLRDWSDNQVLLGLVNERLSDLNPYAPLANRLGAIKASLETAINKAGDQS